MASVSAISPRLRQRALLVLWALVNVAILPGMLLLVDNPAALMTPMLVLGAVAAIPIAVFLWVAWCHTAPVTRQMAAHHHQLRDLLERARDVDMLSAGDQVLMPYRGYTHHGLIDGFLRLPAAAPAPAVSTVDGRPAPRTADLFFLYEDEPVILYEQVTVEFTLSGRPRPRLENHIDAHLRSPASARDRIVGVFQRARHARDGLGVATLADLGKLITQVRSGLDWPSAPRAARAHR